MNDKRTESPVDIHLSGLGLATAKWFADEGAFVFITGRRKSELDEAGSQIGRSVTGVQGHVSKPADLDKVYAAMKEQKGEFDIVFSECRQRHRSAETRQSSASSIILDHVTGRRHGSARGAPLPEYGSSRVDGRQSGHDPLTRHSVRMA